MDMTTTFSPRIGFSDVVYQTYVQGLKMQWKNTVYAEVVQDATQANASDACTLETYMRGHSAAYRLYGWLERNLQQFKYLGRHGVIPVMAAQERELTAALDTAAARHPQRLRLDPELQLPAYYTQSDFHQHPGGVWSDDADAFAYEWAANAFSFSMIAADGPYRWLAEYLSRRFGGGSLIDLGCGFGKLVIPYAQVNPGARVVGVDLSAPCLRLAHLRALEAGVEALWLQANAEHVPLEDGSFDGAVSYWLFHELPQQAAQNVLAEAYRLVRPGGFFASLDMYVAPGGVAGTFLQIGHGARNAEPYLPGMFRDDPCAQLRAAGFVDVELVEAMTGAPETRQQQALPSSRTHVFSVVIGSKPS
jgi:ubiquinone/menaquinone biosynthesis C-methylase UbiE